MSVLATDTFTAADNTPIDSRPCDTGQNWTKTADSDAANLIIVGNQAQLSALTATAFSRYTLDVSLGNADYTITATLKKSVSGFDSIVALMLRSSGSTYYEFRRAAGSTDWFIARKIGGGAETTLATLTAIASEGVNPTTVTASVSGVGATVSLSMRIQIPANSYDQTLTFNDTDATRIVTTGLPAIAIFESGTLNEVAWDDVQVDGTAGLSAPVHFVSRSVRRR